MCMSFDLNGNRWRTWNRDLEQIEEKKNAVQQQQQHQSRQKHNFRFNLLLCVQLDQNGAKQHFLHTILVSNVINSGSCIDPVSIIISHQLTNDINVNCFHLWRFHSFLLNRFSSIRSFICVSTLCKLVFIRAQVVPQNVARWIESLVPCDIELPPPLIEQLPRERKPSVEPFGNAKQNTLHSKWWRKKKEEAHRGMWMARQDADIQYIGFAQEIDPLSQFPM